MCKTESMKTVQYDESLQARINCDILYLDVDSVSVVPDRYEKGRPVLVALIFCPELRLGAFYTSVLQSVLFI